MDKKPKKCRIAKWKPKKQSEVIVEQDGKLFICHFDKVFHDINAEDGSNRFKPYNIFIIGKESYINQLPTIVNYTNFFINEYDNEDMELVTAYLKIKFALDKLQMYKEADMDAYIGFIYDVLFTPTMIDKITRMVDDNYIDDIETAIVEEPEGGTTKKKKYVKSAKKHLESLEFTNLHVKILLAVSFGMKIMGPVLFHFIQKNGMKITKDSDIIFRFYKRLFIIFGYGETFFKMSKEGIVLEDELTKEDIDRLIEKDVITDMVMVHDERRWLTRDDSGIYYTQYKINIYNKLFVYVKAKVLESNASNGPIFSQREIFGVDVFSVINQFTKKVLISENVVKYKFNESTSGGSQNIIGFNKTILKIQLTYFLKDKYSKNLTEVTNSKNSEGLSGADKLLMNSNKLDEGVLTISEINTRMTLDEIKKDIDVPYTEEEVQYYMEHHKPSEIQIQLVHSYYAKYFGSYRDLINLPRHDYMLLLVLLKKKLLLELGYDADEREVHYASLPYILTGNLEDKLNTRIIRNNRFTSKIEDSYIYKYLVEKKYALLEEISPDNIKSLLSIMVNSRFTYVCYERQDLIDTEISFSEDKIADELLFFISCI